MFDNIRKFKGPQNSFRSSRLWSFRLIWLKESTVLLLSKDKIYKRYLPRSAEKSAAVTENWNTKTWLTRLICILIYAEILESKKIIFTYANQSQLIIHSWKLFYSFLCSSYLWILIIIKVKLWRFQTFIDEIKHSFDFAFFILNMNSLRF